MVQTMAMSADTATKLTAKLNDWLRGLSEDKILDINFIYRPNHLIEPYLAFVTYRK